MAEPILVLGESGTGKTTSMRNLDPESTVYFNISGKSMPLPQWKQDYNKENSNYVTFDSTDPKKIATNIQKMLSSINKNKESVECVIIDDLQYMMAFEFFNRALEGGWDKFNEIGKNFADVLIKPRSLRDDLFVVFMSHIEDVGGQFDTKQKMKTIGKMVDEKLTPEGLFTVVLVTGYDSEEENSSNGYYFQTNGEGIAKSPMEMFDEQRVPNDLNSVINRIKEYNG